MSSSAAFLLLSAAVAVASPLGQHEVGATLSSSSSAIARRIHNCNKPAPPTVYFPLNFRYGPDEKIGTDLVIPGTNKTMAVCFDQGSEDYWVLAPDSVINWGAQRPGAPGPCNATASPIYEYSESSDASSPEHFDLFAAYGGYNKFVQASEAVNDTMTFTSVAGQRSTIPNLRTALVEFVSVVVPDETGNCAAVPKDLSYDAGILGIAPYRDNADGTTNGPHVRQELLERGVIKAPVQSLWMDKRPDGVKDTYTGGAIFGGIDLSKFTGPLVRVPVVREDDYTIGYYVAPPKISFKGKEIKTDNSEDRCFVDSGTRNDVLPVIYEDEKETFFKTTGLVESEYGDISWPSACEDVPSDVTLDLTFPGTKNGTSVDIKIPLKNYVRYDLGEEGLCRLNLYVGTGCTLAAPFSTAAFFAADDERGEVAFAQGGISERGSSPTEESIVLRIP
ncbi:aspartic peptidase domain-containing protein [Poronia punctata]|nr:aspartic peptidase domain-containing protein [Poronia punctata]